MKFLNINNSSDPNFKLSWQTYFSSFPDYEKRTLSMHEEAAKDSRFELKAIYDNEKYIGFIFYWDISPFIFIEHFAIDEKARNKSYGSKIINKVISDNPNSTIILEIDPPIDEISKRRLSFYSRLGFVNNDILHYNLPYKKDLELYRLNLLSHGRLIDDLEYKLFHSLLLDSAEKYCE